MGVSWCKVASNLDSHPKIRRAGRLGREVFLFALRRNAEPGNTGDGRLPAEELADWYIADQLLMSVTEAVTGVTAAVTAGLLALEGDSYLIVGWKEGWGKDNGSGAERTARWRENRKIQSVTPPVTSPNVTVTTGDGCDTDQKRLEETRLEEKRVRGARPKRAAQSHLPAGWSPSASEANAKAEQAARARGVDVTAEMDRFRDYAVSRAWTKADWDATWRNWTRSANPTRGGNNPTRESVVAYALRLAEEGAP